MEFPFLNRLFKHNYTDIRNIQPHRTTGTNTVYFEENLHGSEQFTGSVIKKINTHAQCCVRDALRCSRRAAAAVTETARTSGKDVPEPRDGLQFREDQGDNQSTTCGT